MPTDLPTGISANEMRARENERPKIELQSITLRVHITFHGGENGGRSVIQEVVAVHPSAWVDYTVITETVITERIFRMIAAAVSTDPKDKEILARLENVYPDPATNKGTPSHKAYWKDGVPSMTFGKPQFNGTLEEPFVPPRQATQDDVGSLVFFRLEGGLLRQGTILSVEPNSFYCNFVYVQERSPSQASLQQKIWARAVKDGTGWWFPSVVKPKAEPQFNGTFPQEGQDPNPKASSCPEVLAEPQFNGTFPQEGQDLNPEASSCPEVLAERVERLEGQVQSLKGSYVAWRQQLIEIRNVLPKNKETGKLQQVALDAIREGFAKGQVTEPSEPIVEKTHPSGRLFRP